MNIELFCKALSDIYSRRYGVKITIIAERKEDVEAVKKQQETEVIR